MRYRPGLTTLALCFALLCLVGCVLAWMRPVRTVVMPSPTEAMDAKTAEAEHWHAKADSAMVRAAWWQAVAETARAERTDAPALVDKASRALHDADIDSFQAVIYGPVR